MDEISIVKKQVQKAEWTERIRKCSESGLTVSEWCRENGINLKTCSTCPRKLLFSRASGTYPVFKVRSGSTALPSGKGLCCLRCKAQQTDYE